MTLSFGTVTVSEQVLAFQRKQLGTREVLALEALDLPRTEYTTQALWYELAGEVLGDDCRSRCCSARCTRPSTRRSRCCRCSRCATAGTSAACRRTCTRRPAARRSSSTTGTPAASASRARASCASRSWRATRTRLIGECPCESGCPSCVQSPKCGNLNEPLHKAGALELLDAMLAGLSRAHRACASFARKPALAT